MTKLEILEESIQYYNEDTSRRGVDDEGTCMYVTADCRMCMVGRCMIDPTKVRNRPVTEMKNLDVLLKPEYRGHSLDFWFDLQVLHDCVSNWDKNGLTFSGQQNVQRIKRRYVRK